MELNAKVAKVAKFIIDLFRDPSKLPEALAQTFFVIDGPADKRSYGNKLLAIAQTGTADLRTYKQWLSVGRKVKPADERTSGIPYIFAPLTKRYEEEVDGKKEKRFYIFGYRVIPCYPIWDTEGDEIEVAEIGLEGVQGRLMDVATKWGIDVSPVTSLTSLAWYRSGTKSIGLATQNVSSFAHELVHAAEDRLGRLTKPGIQDPEQEIVAELGGAVLLTMLGYESDADLGGAYKYVKAYAGGDTLKACNRLIKRVGEAVELILDVDG